MKCPVCDHEDSRTEKFLNEQIGNLTRQLMQYKQVPTLRDQFAMAALTGCIIDRRQGFDPEGYAMEAYKIADAMLAAREEKP